VHRVKIAISYEEEEEEEKEEEEKEEEEKEEEEGNITLSSNMTFNKVFDLLISTEKACA
jgi:hypothetical protein